MSLYDPRNRKELFLKGVLDGDQNLPDPITREEIYLKAIADASPIVITGVTVVQGSGTSSTDVMSQEAVNKTVSSVAKAVYNIKTAGLSQGWIDNGGVFKPLASYRCTEPIYVTSGESLSYTLSHATTAPIIAFYNTSGTYVAASSVIGINGYSSGTYTASADGFIRFVYLASKADVYVKFDGDYLDRINTTITSEISESSDDIYKRVYAIRTDNTSAGWINTGGTVSLTGQYHHTDYLSVKTGEVIKYRLSHGVANAPMIAFYSTAKVYDSTKSVLYSSGAYIDGTYTVSADGFVIFTYLDSRPDVTAVFYEAIPDNIRLYYKNEVLRDLKVVFLGDSIFGNDGEIPSYMGRYVGQSYNCAFGGTRVSNRSTGDWQYFDGANLSQAIRTGVWTNQDAAAANLEGSYPWITGRLADLKAVDFNNVDIVITDWGTNDYAAGATIAEIEAGYDTVISNLQKGFPGLRMLICTPIWRYFSSSENGDNKVFNVSTLKEIAEAIEQHAKDKRISVLNAYQNMPLSYDTASTYFDSGDGTHLNSTGNEVYTHLIRGKLNTLY